MDSQELSQLTQLTIVICKQPYFGENKYYVLVVINESIRKNDYYLKRNGQIEPWGSNDDYMGSYEECTTAIKINHDIIEELELAPKEYRDYVAPKEV